MKKMRVLVALVLCFSLFILASSAEEYTFSLGEWADNVFTNESAGYTFKLPYGWYVANADEIVALTGGTNEGVVYDLYALNPLTGTTVAVALIPTPVGNSEANYTALVTLTKAGFEASGMFGDIEEDTASIAGYDYTSLSGVAEVSGMTVSQCSYLRLSDDGFIVLITIAAIGDEVPDVLLENFAPVA